MTRGRGPSADVRRVPRDRMSSGPLSVVHVITGLGTGGAELVLARLLDGSDRARYRWSVISLTTVGEVGERLRASGWSVRHLGMSAPTVGTGMARLVRWLRRDRPDVVQTWMYHADLVGGVAARLAGVRHVVWNLRTGRPETLPRRTRLVVRVGAGASRRLPTAIVCGSHAAAESHGALGYERARMVVIPNGFALPAMDPALHGRVRRDLGVPPEAILIGQIARWHTHKDHPTFLRAMAILHLRFPNVWLLLAGTGTEVAARSLRNYGIGDRALVLGARHDVGDIMSALDVACSSSVTEGLPNTIGEAMARGVPCVATAVGDSERLIADTGRVVPVGEPEAFAAACAELVVMPSLQRRHLGDAARDRIRKHYSLGVMVTRYEDLYRSLVTGVQN